MSDPRPRRASRPGVTGLLLVLLLAVFGFRCATRDDVSPDGDGGVAAGGPGGGARGGGDAGSGSSTAEPSTGGPDAPGAGAGAPTRRPRAARPVAPVPAVPPVAPRPASADGSGRSPKGSGSASPWGRFTLVGGHDASQTAEQFGDSVDIDGDVAVIGAPGHRVGIVQCGAAYVYARGEDRVWKLVQRIDSPRPDMYGFAECVRVSGSRIAVFGGHSAHGNAAAFRTYVRSADGQWTLEAEVVTDPPIWLDAAMEGDRIVVGSGRALTVYERRAGSWAVAQSLSDVSVRFAASVALAGDTIAAGGDDGDRPDGRVAVVYRRRGAVFARETVLASRRGYRAAVAVARHGSAVICTDEAPPLLIDEVRGAEWVRTVEAAQPFPGGPKGRFDGLLTMGGRHPVAADGDVAVASGRDFDAFGLLVRRDDGWHSTRIEPPAPPDGNPNMWPAWHPDVAISGRSVVVGTAWDGRGSGRAWFFDVTDADLARAVPIPPSPPK